MYTTMPITLSLVVEDLVINYVGKENSGHLILSIQKFYTISID